LGPATNFTGIVLSRAAVKFTRAPEADRSTSVRWISIEGLEWAGSFGGNPFLRGDEAEKRRSK